MAHALLLSPDDQAVSAISGVLEEMSVTWERPLDGPSAAKKLNSQSFDLVLVDCENLPAAKLIFDVCRRPRNGMNPVPIAIVDGRAGLPTAFRLGAELILTKPVAKDQARTTIRTAVNRVKKDDSVRPLHLFEEPAPAPAPLLEPRAQAVAAAASAGGTQPAPSAPPVPAIETTTPPPVAPPPAKMAAPAPEVSTEPAPPKLIAPMARDLTPPQSFAPAKLTAAAPPPAPKPAEDPILADLESETPTPVFTSYKEKPPKKSGRGSLLFLLFLILAGGGFYAAWTYQPAFREMMQPWISKAMAAIPGLQKRTPVTTEPPANLGRTPTTQNTPATMVSPATATSGPSSTNSSVAAPESSSAASPTMASSSAATTDASASSPEKQTPEPDKDSTRDKPSMQSVAAAASDLELPGEKNAVILSSRGAENRLVHHVAPTYPAEARKDKIEGTVVLKALIDESGTVTGVRLVEGDPTLATAAIRAVRQWRYRPYARNGRAMAFQTIVLVEFQRR